MGWYSLAGVEVPGVEISGLWPAILGEFVCLYEINSADGRTLYAIPARHNGSGVNVIVSIDEEHPQGIVLGVRQREGYMQQKGFDEISSGDRLAFYHEIRYFWNGAPEQVSEWRYSEELIVGDTLTLDWILPDESFYTSYLITCTQLCDHYTELVSVIEERVA